MATDEPSTRDRLLVAAEELLARHGVHGCGLNEICARSGVAYGSLYHHFRGGKDDLVVAAIERSAAAVNELLEALLAAVSLPEAVDAMFVSGAATLERNDFDLGCPIGTPSASASSDRVRAVTGAAFARWSELIEAAAVRGGHRADAASQLGQTLVALYEGALLTARAQRSVDPLFAAARAAASLVTIPKPEESP